MTKKLALICMLVVLFAGAAFADSVTYNTTGTFGNNTSSSSVFAGLTFTGANTTTNLLTAGGPFASTAWANIALGAFSCNPSFATCPGGTGSDSFTITLHQTSPLSPGQVATVGTITGQLTAGASGLSLNFTSVSFTFGGVDYTTMIPSGGFNGYNYAVQQSENISLNGPNNTTTLQGIVYAPEPSSAFLLATGLLGGLGTLRRRFGK